MILVIAAAAAVMALVSCTKETPDNNGTKEEQNTGLRTLTVSFAPSTRTELNGVQPVWSNGDKIKISNGTEVKDYDVPEAAVGKSSFTITTNLTGTITAVYPAKAADISGNSITGIKVSDKQNGSFGNANICMAEAGVNGTELSFLNKTAVIAVNVPAGTTALTLTSLKKIGNDGQRSGSAVGIAVDDQGQSQTEIKVSNGSTLPTTCYISVAVNSGTDILLEDLNVDITYGESKAQGGFSPKFIDASNVVKAAGKNHSNYALQEGYIYTLPDGSLHEYVIADGKKWATMNVGATETDPNGLYFAWGETTGIMPSGNTFTFPDTKYYSADNSTWDKSKAFSWTNCPYAVGGTSKFNKYVLSAKSYYWGGTGSADNKDTLDLEDDAAFCNWGGAWRMPTTGEFNTFISGASYNQSGIFEYKGVTFHAAGCGNGAKLDRAGSLGLFWSSSLNTDDCSRANDLLLYIIGVYTSSDPRSYGGSVRPFSE